MEALPTAVVAGALIMLIQHMYGFSRRRCSALPLYHAAPLGWSTTAQRLGGTVVVMEKFDATHCLELIEQHQVTHAQFVPTHFVRMLKLTPEGAPTTTPACRWSSTPRPPCPVEVKRQMISGGASSTSTTPATRQRLRVGNGLADHPGTVGEAGDRQGASSRGRRRAAHR
jgi:fatty-acyl-CoA synthase